MFGAGSLPRPLRVCLVEDHDQLRARLVERLEAAGHEVCAAVATIAGGIDAVRRHRPDVAVLDDRVPDGSGIELCAALTRGWPALVVVIHAGTVDERLEVAGRAAGALAVVQKSVRGAALLDLLTGLAAPDPTGATGPTGPLPGSPAHRWAALGRVAPLRS